MRYHIIRRKIRITLLLILLAAVFSWATPWIYERFFVHDEGFDYGARQHAAETHSLVLDSITKTLDEGTVLNVSFLGDNYVFSELHIEGLSLMDKTVSADVIIKGRLVKDERDEIVGFSGKLFSRELRIDSYPPAHIRMSFEITRDELEIKSLRLGKSYELKGKVSLISPFKADLRFEINRADIRDFVGFVNPKKAAIEFGVMNGAFNIRGTLSRLFSDGVLHSKNGKVGPVEYDLATIKIEGFGPVINIVDSSIMQGKGSLRMEGYVDLRHIGKGGLLSGLRVKADLERIVWAGWDITKYGADELGMSKDISDKMRVGFKTMTRDPLTTYQDRENPEEMTLEYKVGVENLKMKLKENEEFFGIEHSVKF